MVWRRIALVLALGLLASCGSGSGSDDDNGEKFRTTYRYLYPVADTSLTSQNMPILGDSDITLIQNQTGATQNSALGLIAGRVTDITGTPISGVAVQAHSDAGLPVGAIYYQSGVTGAYTPGLVATSATGRFVVINAAVGRVNLKCFTGADGNLNVRVETSSCIFAQLIASPTGVQPTWNGITCNLIGSGRTVPGPAEASVNYQLLGYGPAPGPVSNATTGAFDLGTVYARHLYLVKCTKAGMIDTYTYVQTVNSNLSAGLGGGNIFITSTANLANEINATGVTLTPGTGIITGRILSGAGGFTVQARHGDQPVGQVLYGSNADNGRPSAVATQTDPDGTFYIYNVPPGLIFIRMTSDNDQAVSTYVDAFADGVTVMVDQTPLNQAQATITISGALASFQGFAVPNGNVRLHGLGIGDESDQFGEFTMTSVPTRHVYIIRTWK